MKAIAMKCSQEQFDAIKPKLKRLKIVDQSSIKHTLGYLTNSYSANIGIVGFCGDWNKIAYEREAFEIWNEEMFLKACDIKNDPCFEITKEQILHIEKTATYAVSRELKEWFPEAFETVLEVGKWYTVKKPKDGSLGFCGIGMYTEEENEAGLYRTTGDYNFKQPDGIIWRTNGVISEATESEVFEALKDELTRLGFVNGVYANPLLDKRDIVKIDLGFKTSFIPSENEFWMGGFCLFKDGVFAEIIPTITKEEAEKLLNKKIV